MNGGGFCFPEEVCREVEDCLGVPGGGQWGNLDGASSPQERCMCFAAGAPQTRFRAACPASSAAVQCLAVFDRAGMSSGGGYLEEDAGCAAASKVCMGHHGWQPCWHVLSVELLQMPCACGAWQGAFDYVDMLVLEAGDFQVCMCNMVHGVVLPEMPASGPHATACSWSSYSMNILPFLYRTAWMFTMIRECFHLVHTRRAAALDITCHAMPLKTARPVVTQLKCHTR